jgi:transcriptional regulator of arginine metabolism
MPSTSQDQREKLKCATAELLQSGKIHSQEELCEELNTLGFEASQSRISRLMHKLGAMKTPDGKGGLVYALPEVVPPPQTTSPILQLVTGVQSNEMCIVIYVNSGSAGLIARLLEFHDHKRDILGTMAGTDTVIVIPKSTQTIQTTLHTVHSILKWHKTL